MRSFADIIEAKSVRVPFSGCWVWMGHLNNKGYGKLGIQYAHRLSFREFVGDIPPGLHILHRCDVPCCVNPEHLFSGTHNDNMADMKGKGRRLGKGPGNHLRGSLCHWAQIKEEDVLEVRRLYATGLHPQQSLAEQFGVTQPLISRIVRRKIWKHL